MTPISKEQLRYLRNQIPMNDLIEHFLRLPSKYSEGFLRFPCPVCAEFNTATNPATNLARCFRCQRNFNPIELVMEVNRCSFLKAIQFLMAVDQPNPRKG